MDELQHNDRGQKILKINVAMIVVSTVAVCLRFWSRAITRSSKFSRGTRFWWDDWLALLNLPFAIGQNSIQIYWATLGLGKHVSDVPQAKVTKGLIILYAAYFLYDFGISIAKFSALFFYARVLGVNNGRFRKSLYVTHSLVVAWLLFAIPSSIFQCTPIARAWQPDLHGVCLNDYKWWLGSAISSVIIDFIILILPLPILWNLQLKATRKLVITCVFVAGYCVIAISIGRLVAVSHVGGILEEDVNYNSIPILYWLSVEAPISILSICLPSIFFLVKRGVQGGPYALLSSRERVSSSKTTSHTWKLSTARSSPPDEEAGPPLYGNATDDSLERLNAKPLGPGVPALKGFVPTSFQQSHSEDDWELPPVYLRHGSDETETTI